MYLGVGGHFEERQLDGTEFAVAKDLVSFFVVLAGHAGLFGIAHVARFTASDGTSRAFVFTIDLLALFDAEEQVALFARLALTHDRFLHVPRPLDYRSHWGRWSCWSRWNHRSRSRRGSCRFHWSAATNGPVGAADREGKVHHLDGAGVDLLTVASLGLVFADRVFSVVAV